MTTNIARIGNFTSGEIYKLMANGKAKDSFGVPALTYIDEKNMERRLGRCLSADVDARAMSWGTLLEAYVFSKLGLEYALCSKDTVVHPEIPCWAGSPDAEKPDTIIDVKAPHTLKAFCELVDPIYKGKTGIDAMNKVRNDHKQGDKYFYQIVSNAILRNKAYGELIVYMPYKSELQDIRDLCSMMEGESLKRFYWIANASDDELPWIPDGGHYKNLNVIRFEIPQDDIEALTRRVLSAEFFLDKEEVTA